MSYHDLADHLQTHSFKEYRLPIDFWELFDVTIKQLLHSRQWTELKYLNETLDWDPEVEIIPNNKGGIYCFYIDSGILPNNGHKILCYIGRAHQPTSNNLKSRIKDYKDYNAFPDEMERPVIRRLFSQWGKVIYCRYFTIEQTDNVNGKVGNDLIDLIEAELINRLLPPCNYTIPNIEIRNAVRAAGL